MPSYYEILQLVPTASATEIESAYEAQYNQWRRLVTHHDPEIVNQANQALQALEKIHTTLGDPTRRAAYDEGIGVSGTIGGLADPSAMLRSIQQLAAPPIPQAPAAVTATQVAAAPAAPISGLWACAKCSTDNPAQTKFCFKCGNQLVRKCPACGKEASLISTGRCGECGVDHDEAVHRNEVRAQIAQLQHELSANEQKRAETLEQSKNSETIVAGWICVVMGIIIALMLLTQSFGWSVIGLLIAVAGVGLIIDGNKTRHQNKAHEMQATSLLENIQRIQGTIQQLNAELGLVADYSSVLACTKCGSENPQNAKFCTKCGYQFAL